MATFRRPTPGARVELLERLFCLRFDVDTHRCIREGVPRLLHLLASESAPVTFFVNMGRAVDHRATLARWLRKTARDAGTPRISARRKLGAGGYLTAALLNPRVGAGANAMVRRIEDEGHEVGLHGGLNHATWQIGAERWSEARFRAEIAGGLRLMDTAGVSRPTGFASPGWQGPARLWPVLEAAGFQYVADAHGLDESLGPAPGSESLLRVPTALTGEPDGVAYLEHRRAIGESTAEILDHFEACLEAAGDFVVAYDHPYHAGLHEIETLRQMIIIARSAGFRIATLAELAASRRRVP